MKKSKGFIRYQIRSKKNSNIVYGSYCIPRRIGNKKKNIELWLGRVIDKKNNIFFTRKQGYYKFTATNNSEEQITLLTENELEQYYNIDITTFPYKNISDKNDKIASMISFGSSYFIYNFIIDNNFDSIFKFIFKSDYDSILSLLIFKIATNNPYSYVHEWWQSSYCRILFPGANLQSQNINELFTNIGAENNLKTFFSQYIDFFKQLNDINTILFYSDGLPNDITSNKIPLIVVMDKVTGLPIYYRYFPDNIVNISTFHAILSELNEYGINIDKLVLDSGFYSEDIISELFNLKIPFMTRMVKYKGKYELLVKNTTPSIESPSNLVHYGEKTFFIKKVKTNIFSSDISVNAYVCCDPEVKRNEELNYFNDQLHFGIFLILTNMDLLPEDILAYYYYRQSMEQLYDYIKNNMDILPAKTRSMETFGGHILISFLATIIHIAIDNKLKKSGLSFIKFLFNMNLFNAKVYKTKISPDIKTKNIQNISKALKIKVPAKIDVN
ncbi:MAG: transposase [Deltaproteobacteria bacterium]|jgi:hypothetical protein|nr:transposase [Deltaproteobacteria bacterium]